MSEYLNPGVYVEEIDAGPKPIEGVSTSTAGESEVTAIGQLPVNRNWLPAFPSLCGSLADSCRLTNSPITNGR